jgi:RNA polymerase sigma-70 factor (ECF subfamily)
VGPSLTDDATLLARTASGDGRAYAELVERHQGKVHRFLVRLLPASAAEDALQETFLRALQKAGSFRGEGSVLSWLLGIAKNEARMLSRKAGAIDRTAVSLETLGAEAGWGQESPEDLASLVDRREALERGIAQLDPSEREVLLMRDVLSLSGEETAAALGISLASMKSRLHRARLRLLAVLKKGGFDGRE